MSAPTSTFVEKNCVRSSVLGYRHTSMVSHRGTPIAFAMNSEGEILYSVLDISQTESSSRTGDDNDKARWSDLGLGGNPSVLRFPAELSQVGYGVVPNRRIEARDSGDQRVVHGYDRAGNPLNASGVTLTAREIEALTSLHLSSTARLGERAPFQVLSDGQHVYVFRQSIAAGDCRNEAPAIVDSTLLVDRFVLSGTVLKLSREVRYQRSRHKTEPESRKDTLSAVDMDGNPFYEPTRELAFVHHLQGGNFSVLLLPGANAEEQRWQIFAADALTKKIRGFNIRFDESILFDTSESDAFIEEFLRRYDLTTSLNGDVRREIAQGADDDAIAAKLAQVEPYKSKGIPTEALAELVYTLRTGVALDDFKTSVRSAWPLIDEDKGKIRGEYTDANGVLLPEYAFDKATGLLQPRADALEVNEGMSSCYYYLQEMGGDGKPMKTRAAVMLAAGMVDRRGSKVIGILNFSVASSGRLSALTTDIVDMPDINVQALDENPVRDLTALTWQAPQPMGLLDIDPDGLSTSGGVLRFAYTSTDFASEFSDATEASAPYLFDDSLGRVNLYFKGKNQNFFVLYFNPQGARSVTAECTSAGMAGQQPVLSLTPRLDRDMLVELHASKAQNCSTLTLQSGGATVEEWRQLPLGASQVAGILNGDGALPLAVLVPLGVADNPTVAYQRPASGAGTILLRTDTDNRLVFVDNALAGSLADGQEATVALSRLSSFLSHNLELRIAERPFRLLASQDVVVRTELFYKAYLAELVDEQADMDKLWGLLQTRALIREIAGGDRAQLRAAALTGSAATLDAALSDPEIDKLALEHLRVGTPSDKAARRAGLRQSLRALIQDIARVRILKCLVNDTSVTAVDALQAGMEVSVRYSYAANFSCFPARLGGTSAPKWEHARSYLFNARADEGPEIDGLRWRYKVNNTIGQWENWEASLALQFSPPSATSGAVLTTSVASKLSQLRPSERGLSVEAWVKPSRSLGDRSLGDPATVLFFKDPEAHYSLALERDARTAGAWRCVATLGRKRYQTRDVFPFLNSNQGEHWRHLAFTHRKNWGYALRSGQTIQCGNDSSLVPGGEMTLELLVRVDAAGTLIEKAAAAGSGGAAGYRLSVNADRQLILTWGASLSLPLGGPLPRLGEFYKITVIRSRAKPQTTPLKSEYPITGGDGGSSSGSGSGEKWYANKKGDELLTGMAEKQDQMEAKMSASQLGMFAAAGAPGPSEATAEQRFFHSLIVTRADATDNLIEWTSSSAVLVPDLISFGDLGLGGDGFTGTFAGVRLWQRALSMEEAHEMSVADNKTGLVAHWRFSEGRDRYIYDDAGENHGTVEVANGWTDSPNPRSPGEMTIYVDGAAVSTVSGEQGLPPDRHQFTLGGRITQSGGRDELYSGVLEEVRVWNRPRTAEQISDNAFGRLKGEWEQLLANYTFDTQMKGGLVPDNSATSAHLTVSVSAGSGSAVIEVLSTAPVATEIPQVRSALTGVITDYHGTLRSRPAVVEYGDVQWSDDGTASGVLKRCYSFVDASGTWTRMTGYKVGDLVSQWFGQAQFAPQVVGYLEGPPPLPGENFGIPEAGTYLRSMDVADSYRLSENSLRFTQAEEVSYSYSTSKEAGFQAVAESESSAGGSVQLTLAPFGFGPTFEIKVGAAAKSSWETSVNRSQSSSRGTTTTTEQTLGAITTYYDNRQEGDKRYWQLGNSGYALVRSKTADIYLLRLAHNDALLSVSWRPNPDVPEDVNIIPFPINPHHSKQGTLDGKFGLAADIHYPQAQGAYGQYSYYKPREAYALKRQIEREQLRLRAYYEDAFDVMKPDARFGPLAATTGIAQALGAVPGAGPFITAAFNQVMGPFIAQRMHETIDLGKELAGVLSQRNIVNTYVWTVEGGYYAESTQVASVQQETYSGATSLSLGGSLGVAYKAEGGFGLEHKSLFGSGNSLTLTRSRSKEARSSFGLEVNLSLPTSPRYMYAGVDQRSLKTGLLRPGTVDAYRFMSFYLEPSGKNFTDLFTQVIDPIWLDQSPDPYALALRQARGAVSLDDPQSLRPCWRIMHRVTYVSRVLPDFQPEAPPSLARAMRVAGLESNHMLIKKFEPYVSGIADAGAFFTKVDQIIDAQLAEFKPYRRQVKEYLAVYFQVGQA